MYSTEMHIYPKTKFSSRGVFTALHRPASHNHAAYYHASALILHNAAPDARARQIDFSYRAASILVSPMPVACMLIFCPAAEQLCSTPYVILPYPPPRPLLHPIILEAAIPPTCSKPRDRPLPSLPSRQQGRSRTAAGPAKPGAPCPLPGA